MYGCFLLLDSPKTPEVLPFVIAVFMRLFRLSVQLCGNECADKDFIIIKICASNLHWYGCKVFSACQESATRKLASIFFWFLEDGNNLDEGSVVECKVKIVSAQKKYTSADSIKLKIAWTSERRANAQKSTRTRLSVGVLLLEKIPVKSYYAKTKQDFFPSYGER